MSVTTEDVIPTHEKLETELLILSGMIESSSKGRVRVAVGEGDDTTGVDTEAAYFLKLDGVRLGRDIQMYGILGRITCDALALASFVEEVLLPIKSAVPGVYDAVAPSVEEAGYRFIDPKNHESWAAIFTGSDR